MERKIIYTKDGSHSISVPEMDVTYHSIHGAVQESRHVFIGAGLLKVSDAPAVGGTSDTRIFEMGFGSGLNALLTLIESEKSGERIYYESIDLFPIDIDEAKRLNYCDILMRNDLQEMFERLHECEWGKEIVISPNFVFKKIQADLLSFQPSGNFHIIFFDAFDPRAQPQLWTEQIFKRMHDILVSGGILTTYSSKGAVRRAMQSAGFRVEKIPGPAGKREIVRAFKI